MSGVDLDALEGKRATDVVDRSELPAKAARGVKTSMGRPFGKLDMQIVTINGEKFFRVSIFERELVAAFGYSPLDVAEAHLVAALAMVRAAAK